MKQVVHFDVDAEIAPFLKGEKYPFSFHSTNVNKMQKKDRYTAISIKSQSKVSEKELIRFPSLKLIVTRTVGTDHIDMEACKKRGIEVKNIPDYGSHNIAEHALALLLAGARHIVPANTSTHKGTFDYKPFIGTSIQGKTVGIVGTGKIGIALIKLLQGFGVKIVAYDVYKNEQAAKEYGFSYTSLDTLLRESDFISVHVPLFPTTHHLLGEKEITLIKKGVVLVNTSRGEIVDTKALIKHHKKFHAVCLDVLEGEKEFSKKHPILKYSNVTITPHIGFYTDDSIRTIALKTEEIITNLFK